MRNLWVLVFAVACSATEAPPGAPSELTVVALDGAAHVTWKDNSSNELHFMVERKDTGQFLTVGTVPANTTEYHDAAVQVGTTYTYRVTAMTAGNSVSSSPEVTFTATAAGPDMAGADLTSFAGSSCHTVPCRKFSSYCDTCECLALPKDATDPLCTGTVVNCATDPCVGMVASCNHTTGKCQIN